MKIKLSRSQWEGIGKKAGWFNLPSNLPSNVIDSIKSLDRDKLIKIWNLATDNNPDVPENDQDLRGGVLDVLEDILIDYGGEGLDTLMEQSLGLVERQEKTT